MLSIQLLLIFMIIAALVAVEIPDMLSSVIALGTVGLGLSLAFLLLQAPDLAVILLIIEVLTLSTLIRTVKDRGTGPLSAFDRVAAAAAAVFIALFLSVSYLAVKELPSFGSPLLRTSGFYIREGLAKTGVPNLVAAVALDFRALDTLSSFAVLFATALGVAFITSRAGRKKE